MSSSVDVEFPTPRELLARASVEARAGRPAQAVRFAQAACDTSEALVDWLAAAAVVRRWLPTLPPLARSARVAVIGSYTTTQLAALLPLAASRCGVALEMYEGGYGQYRQEVLDPRSGLAAFRPDVVVLAVHAGEIDLPDHSDQPEADVERELARWTSLWDLIRDRWSARVVQHTFALPVEAPLGHLSSRVPGSGVALRRRLNARMGEAAGTDVLLVDCDNLASSVGKRTWFDPRYWYRSKQAVSLDCVPLLARHTAAVIAASLGQSKKCLVLDLDNTLWGGVLGEDGIEGVRLGDGEVGEAYSAFQAYLKSLQARGVLLAVASKNNPNDAREMFLKRSDMRLTLEDFAVFSASWEDKATQVRHIATTLGLGLDSLVFVDDNPAEREAIRRMVPEVDVIRLPEHPSGYVRALVDYPWFEPAVLTVEDGLRTQQYRARAESAELRGASATLEDYLKSLQMVAVAEPMTEATQVRVAQLIGKTNQFNLTGRRRSLAEVAAVAQDPAHLILCVRLRDRFADHGVVGVMIGAETKDGVLDIDTWLLSCRVIGRTLEHEMLIAFARQAAARGCTVVRGIYLPSAKNALVADLFSTLGFHREPPTMPRRTAVEESSTWLARIADLHASPGFISMS